MICAIHHWNRINEYFSMNYTKNNFWKMSNLGKVILFSPFLSRFFIFVSCFFTYFYQKYTKKLLEEVFSSIWLRSFIINYFYVSWLRRTPMSTIFKSAVCMIQWPFFTINFMAFERPSKKLHFKSQWRMLAWTRESKAGGFFRLKNILNHI